LHTHTLTEGESHEGHDHDDPQIFKDTQLAFLVDPVLRDEDVNRDGFIDYAEFIAATIKKRVNSHHGVRSSS
jgi:hypothetical protein